MEFTYAIGDRVIYKGETGTVIDHGLKEATATDEFGVTTVIKQVPVYLFQADSLETEVSPDAIAVIGDAELSSGEDKVRPGP